MNNFISSFAKGVALGVGAFWAFWIIRYIRLNWEPEERLVVFGILVLAAIAALCIFGGWIMNRAPGQHRGDDGRPKYK